MQLDWDPEIDTPATIAIIGGGPVGVEAALYARFLGYYVMLFDARRVGSRLIRWGDHSLPVAWGEATSPLGLAALEAQDALAGIPSPDAVVSCRDYVEKYLLPIAKSDLIIESVQINSPAISISRAHWPKGQPAAIEVRAEDEFRVLIDSKVRGQYTQLADVVLDCSGAGRSPTGLGPGGGQAIGQMAQAQHFEVGVRDAAVKDRDKFVGKHTLMFGSGIVACYNAVQWAKLVQEHPGTKLTWIIPQGRKREDWLRSTAEHAADLAIDVSSIAKGDCDFLIPIEAWGAESIARDATGKWQVNLLVGEEDTLDVTADVVLVTETRGGWDMADGLAIDLCPHGRLSVAAKGWLAGQSQSDLLKIAPESFVTSEPHYYVLGSKSVDSDPRFTFAQARQQIQQVFAMIGGRAGLDLYTSVRPQCLS